MKLSDYKNEDALEVLANILEPASEILQDEKVKRALTGGNMKKIELVKMLFKNHKTSIVAVMAALNNVPVDEYQFNIISGTKQLLELLNDEELVSFFQASGQTMTESSFGQVTDITQEKEK